jgi:hypothetical protein
LYKFDSPTQKGEFTTENTTDCVFYTIADWCRRTGMSRSGTYEAMARGNLKAIKLGHRTLIDVRHGLDWLSALPAAVIGKPKPNPKG